MQMWKGLQNKSQGSKVNIEGYIMVCSRVMVLHYIADRKHDLVSIDSLYLSWMKGNKELQRETETN